MAFIKILEEYCKSCGLCVEFCPRGAISIGRHLNSQGYNPAVFDDSKQCGACGNCTAVCPDAAIELYAPKKKATGDRPQATGEDAKTKKATGRRLQAAG